LSVRDVKISGGAVGLLVNTAARSHDEGEIGRQIEESTMRASDEKIENWIDNTGEDKIDGDRGLGRVAEETKKKRSARPALFCVRKASAGL
jgi:hypothetical protein